MRWIATDARTKKKLPGLGEPPPRVKGSPPKMSTYIKFFPHGIHMKRHPRSRQRYAKIGNLFTFRDVGQPEGVGNARGHRPPP